MEHDTRTAWRASVIRQTNFKPHLDGHLPPLVDQEEHFASGSSVSADYQHFGHHPSVFEVFGVDFMMDTDLNLWFLEIVPSPGFQGDTPDKARI
jgi:hypothetical protein